MTIISIRRTVTAVIVAVSALIWPAGPIYAQFALYDNFADATIDASKWQGFVMVAPITYATTLPVPPISDLKSARLLNDVENCTGSRKSVVMDALFDNVNVRRAP